MEKVKAAVYPYSILLHLLVLLWVDWPVAWLGGGGVHLMGIEVVLVKRAMSISSFFGLSPLVPHEQKTRMIQKTKS